MATHYIDETNQRLIELYKQWSDLIKRRAFCVPLSQERARLDRLYLQCLPIMCELTDCNNKQDCLELVRLVAALLAGKGGALESYAGGLASGRG
jgi:hypothetical protein